MEQEWNVVVLDHKIAFENFCRERQAVEIFRLQTRPRRIQMDAAILAIARTRNLIDWFAFGKFNDRMVEFTGNNEIDFRIVHQTIRFDLNMRTDEGYF